MEKTVKRGRVGRNLTEGPIFKTLLVFAVPMVLTNLVQQVYGMVDLIIAGQFVGKTGTVGVSTGGELADLLLPVATAFAQAGQIYIAQLVGAKDEERVKETVGTLLSWMLLLSLIGMAGCIVFHTQILHLFNCPAEAFGQATDYMIITAVGFPFIFGYNAVCGILRGLGESKRPLLFVSIAAVINIFADVFFVIFLHMEAAGTAIATVLSQLGCFIAAFVYMYKRREQFDFEFRLSYFKLKKEPFQVIVKLGAPQFTKSLLVHFSMLWVNVSINSYGIVASATNSVGNKIQKFLNLFIGSVEMAASSMVAQNLGAKKQERAKDTILYTFYFCCGLAAIGSILSVLFPRQLFGVFTQDPEVIEMGVIYMQILVIGLFMAAFTGSFQSMVTGSGFVSLGFLLGIMDGVVCRIGFSLLFLYVFHQGVISFFWGTALSRTIPGIICLIYFLSGNWRRRKLLSEK